MISLKEEAKIEEQLLKKLEEETIFLSNGLFS